MLTVKFLARTSASEDPALWTSLLPGGDPTAFGVCYTFADITATCAVDFSKWVKASPLENYSNIAEWHGRMVKRANYGA